MKISITCPACRAVGSVVAEYVGKQVRCRHCKCDFVVFKPGEPEEESYSLEEPTAQATVGLASIPEHGSVFVSSRGDEQKTAPRPRKSKRVGPRSAARAREKEFAWRNWLIGCTAVAAVVVAGIIVFVPQGKLIAGSALIVAGSAMLLTGFLVGAYAAFGEDFIYGVLYLFIPLYTAYYLVTRWDDLWVWCTCSTAGVGLILLGTEIARWGGVGG
jgi:hypothetical protein